MLEKYNRYKLLKIFLFNPTESFRLRELSRMSGISPASVMNYMKEFQKEELIRAFTKRSVPYYKAEIDNDNFREYRKISVLFELHNSGLIDFLWEKLSPEAIIFYGSYSKGEAVEDSDLDLYIVGKEKSLNLSDFEKTLGIKIHLMFEEDPKKIPKELKNNLVNGIVLRGYFRVF
jgi:predicted nucleotidyltransferase